MNIVFIYLKFILSSIIYFPAVVIHELMHAFGAALTFSHISNFSVIPRIKFFEGGAYEIVYGSVRSSPKLEAFYIITALAPITMWFMAYYLLQYFGILRIEYASGVIAFAVDFNQFSNYSNLFIFYVVWQLIWGGFPSRADIKVATQGVLSISFLVMVGFIYTGYYLSTNGLQHVMGRLLN
jgi:hypothetical protein